MKNDLRIFGSEITRLLCSLAIIFIAFAHTASPSNAMPSQLSAYALPDGTTPDICFNSGNNYDGGSSVKSECEFCRIAGAVLPALSSVTGLHVAFASVKIIAPNGQVTLANSVLLSVRSLRGPPKA